MTSIARKIVTGTVAIAALGAVFLGGMSTGGTLADNGSAVAVNIDHVSSAMVDDLKGQGYIGRIDDGSDSLVYAPREAAQGACRTDADCAYAYSL